MPLPFSLLDILALIFLLWELWRGWRRGLIYTLGQLLAMGLALFLASRLALPLAGYLQGVSWLQPAIHQVEGELLGELSANPAAAAARAALGVRPGTEGEPETTADVPPEQSGGTEQAGEDRSISVKQDPAAAEKGPGSPPSGGQESWRLLDLFASLFPGSSGEEGQSALSPLTLGTTVRLSSGFSADNLQISLQQLRSAGETTLRSAIQSLARQVIQGILRALCFFILFLLLSFLLGSFMRILGHFINKIPVLGFVNRILGLAFALFSSLLILLAVFSLLGSLAYSIPSLQHLLDGAVLPKLLQSPAFFQRFFS